jgi:hypothetical protein
MAVVSPDWQTPPAGRWLSRLHNLAGARESRYKTALRMWCETKLAGEHLAGGVQGNKLKAAGGTARTRGRLRWIVDRFLRRVHG